MMYLTGSTNKLIEEFAGCFWEETGLMIQPGNSCHLKLDRFSAWAADNGCFSDKWEERTWWTWLEKVSEIADQGSDWTCEITGDTGHDDLRERCLFAVAPDVVGDAEATLERSTPWLAPIRELGLPVAFVAQDGAEKDVENLIPWGQFDVLFLGGSTEWKLDPNGAGKVAEEAVRRNVSIHMGRVNSQRRLALAEAWQCESADGTFLKFAPNENTDRVAGWFDGLRSMAKSDSAEEKKKVERLRRILNTPAASSEDAAWVRKIVKSRPEWAVPVLREFGFGEVTYAA